MQPSTVILRDCRDYDADRIYRQALDALTRLDLRPAGRVLLKPNVVAAGRFFPDAYTRPELVEGVLRALAERGRGRIRELAVGERCGITVPTRYSFREAGYYAMADRAGAELYHFDEVRQRPLRLRHEGRLRDEIFAPAPVLDADFFVNCPKFKAHPWTTVTFCTKNYIGLQDDRHRLIDHDHRLDAKVADLQALVQPRFVAVDAITAGEGRMLTPLPFPLGLVIFGDNQVAVDAVCCRIIGLDPDTIPHIRLSSERGFGPIDLRQIKIEGDVSLAEARERAAGFKVGLVRVEDYFRGTRIRAYAGPPPGDAADYCWGGCPGALQEAIELLRVFDKATDDRLRPLHIIFGRYEGPIDAGPDDQLVFIGDCAEFHGEAAGRDLHIPSRYDDRARQSPRQATTEDIFAKMARFYRTLGPAREQRVLRLPGCPVSVAEQVLALVALGGAKNPYFDPENMVGFTSAYLSWRSRTLLQRLLGQPYHALA